jgi:hypothetical protein
VVAPEGWRLTSSPIPLRRHTYRKLLAALAVERLRCVSARWAERASRARIGWSSAYQPAGFFGLLYWDALTPIHPRMFRGLPEALVAGAQLPAHAGGGPCTSARGHVHDPAISGLSRSTQSRGCCGLTKTLRLAAR